MLNNFTLNNMIYSNQEERLAEIIGELSDANEVLINDLWQCYKGDAIFEEENTQKTELLKKAEELITKVNELKAEAEKLS